MTYVCVSMLLLLLLLLPLSLQAITSQMDPKLRQALSREQEASLRRSEKGEEDENEEQQEQALPSSEVCCTETHVLGRSWVENLLLLAF